MLVRASIVLPVFNEAENIRKSIEKAHEVICKRYEDFEILVVDNCSTDATKVILNDLVNLFPKLRIVYQSTNVGYAKNVAAGIAESKGENIFVFDGDGQFDFSAIIEMDVKLGTGVDLVLGYRTQIAGPVFRKVLSRVFLLCARRIIRFDLRDINAGARGLTRKLALQIPDTRGTSMINAEIFLLARAMGYLIDEVEVGHERRAGGYSSHQFLKPHLMFKDTIGYLLELRKFTVREED